MATKLEKQLSYEDHVKQIIDTMMIERGFYPVNTPASTNLDATVFGYKCNNKKCRCPYGFVSITGLEEMQNEGKIENLLKMRCEELLNNHNCKSTVHDTILPNN